MPPRKQLLSWYQGRIPLFFKPLMAATVALLLFFAAPSWAEDDGAQVDAILSAMLEANRTLDYQGIFTYEFAGVMKSVRVTHRVKDGIEHERWLSLTGPRHEVIRHGDTGDCDQGLEGPMRALALQPALATPSHLRTNYELFLRAEDRIADRPVWVIHIIPRDQLRYGYIFAVDKETGLLLQSLLLDDSKRVLERFQYMAISYQPDGDEIVVSSQEDSPRCPSGKAMTPADSGWQLTWMPPGFTLVSHRVDEQGLETQLYTDGLSVFSIFFDPNGSAELPEVQAQRGAMAAQLARVQAHGKDYVISVVGEIPLKTAQRIAGFVRYPGNE